MVMCGTHQVHSALRSSDNLKYISNTSDLIDL